MADYIFYFHLTFIPFSKRKLLTGLAVSSFKRIARKDTNKQQRRRQQRNTDFCRPRLPRYQLVSCLWISLCLYPPVTNSNASMKILWLIILQRLHRLINLDMTRKRRLIIASNSSYSIEIYVSGKGGWNF